MLALFKYNQDRLVQAYCRNIDAPEVLCVGHCFFAKQITELITSTPAHNEQISTVNPIQNIHLLPITLPSLTLPSPLTPTLLNLSGLAPPSPTQVDIFHPPQG